MCEKDFAVRCLAFFANLSCTRASIVILVSQHHVSRTPPVIMGYVDMWKLVPTVTIIQMDDGKWAKKQENYANAQNGVFG
jgi:hypothetical protein